MLDLSKIKNITIAEGSVTKITDSSGVVLWQKQTGSSASLDIDLNNQWIESTKTLDGYKVYMSNSNHNVDNGYASMKFKFKGMPDFKIWINSYAESSYDYTVAYNLDVDYPTSNPAYNSTGVKAHTSGNQKDPTTIDNFTEVDYANDGGEHFVVVTYRKDSSVNNNDDRGYVAVKFTLISTTWVVSSTEFIKKDNKYYERINEVGTYEGGVTANTGNYKEGNELTVTYHQGTADDYMVVGSGKYYKNYIYVTPKDQEINTGDYIQGDYIGEATPSMKVTYTDNTEKTFYNLTSIEKDTDSNKKNAKSVEIYDSVTSIGGWAFYGCSRLTDITIPNSVTSIGDNAFYECSSLTSITIPTGVTRIEDSTFDSCRSLSSVTIPSGVTFIGYQAFGGCRSLSSVTIPSGVTTIANSAFEYCSSLTGITIPSGVTRIENSTFSNCSSLSSITIPNSVTYIENLAFIKCSSLATVTIENSTSKLAYYTNAFANISSTAKLYVPSNLLADYQSDSNWTEAFKGGIFAIGAIPSMKVKYVDGTENKFYGLTSIEKDTDSNKANAKEVEIYDGVTSIGNQAFYACTNLTDVTLSNSLVTIDFGVFFGCSNLTGIRLPESVTIIGEYAFCLCSSITSITIPTNVTEIGKNTFNQCSKLTEITFKETTPPTLDSTAFSDSGIQTIYVPAASLDAYKSATNWSDYASKIKAIGS